MSYPWEMCLYQGVDTFCWDVLETFKVCLQAEKDRLDSTDLRRAGTCSKRKSLSGMNLKILLRRRLNLMKGKRGPRQIINNQLAETDGRSSYGDHKLTLIT